MVARRSEAIQQLRAAGHAEIAAELERWRNVRGQTGGWDQHFRGRHPTLCYLVGLPPPAGAHAPRRRLASSRAGTGSSEVLQVTPLSVPGAPWPILPDDIVHADWSIDGTLDKRQVVRARRVGRRYVIGAPRRAPSDLLTTLLRWANAGRCVVAGFDFVIGLPIAYARATRNSAAGEGLALSDTFLSALCELPAEFWTPQDDPYRVCWRRPFFAHSNAGWKTLALLAPERRRIAWIARRILDDPAATREALLREPERERAGRPAASPAFIMCGAAQVGKASLSGWRELLLPALTRHRDVVRIWPFDGTLKELVRPGTVTLVETYPAECYLHFGIHNKNKQRQGWRRQASELVLAHASKSTDLRLSRRLRKAMAAGFGQGRSGEDPFDAMVGAVMMTRVVLGQDAAVEPPRRDELKWEGWIFGRE
jgi:hypothetical protein